MKCPFCGSPEDKVVDSRQLKDAREIRRRRECVGCERRFTTYERILEALPAVVKVNGDRQPFDRDKIVKGLMYACAKRPVSVDAVIKLAEDVEREVSEMGVPEIDSRKIGECVLPKLRLLDQVAYVRYASIYRDFRDLDEFIRELDDLKEPQLESTN